MKKIMLCILAITATGALNAQESAGGFPVTFSATSLSTSGTNRAVVDMNGDFLDDVVSISSTNVNIREQQPDGSFTTRNISTTSAN